MRNQNLSVVRSEAAGKRVKFLVRALNQPKQSQISFGLMKCDRGWLAADVIADVADGLLMCDWSEPIAIAFFFHQKSSSCHCEAAGKRVKFLVRALNQPKQSLA